MGTVVPAQAGNLGEARRDFFPEVPPFAGTTKTRD
jgi:hypothetical protein